MKKTLFLLVFAIVVNTKAQNVTIPDGNFKTYLIGNTSINTNGDGEIQVSEASIFTGTINCVNKSIANLKGIEAFVNLTSLICYGNQLTSLDISKNTKLVSLYCHGNRLKSLNLKNGKNTALSIMDATSNPDLTCIQVDNSDNANIYSGWTKDAKASYNTDCESTVYFPSPNFKTYLVGKTNINLNGDNEIQVFEAEAFTGTIDCSNRSINSLVGIEAFTKLTNLYCNQNSVANLDLSKNLALVELECNNNLMYILDVSKNTALKKLTCIFNQLSNLDLSKSTVLKYINCSVNQLATLDLSNNTALEELVCESNHLTNINVSNSTFLQYLDCRGNELSNLNLTNNTALTDLNFSENALITLDLSKNTALKNLTCYNNLLTNLDVSKNQALTLLNCGFNMLTSLDVSKNTMLTVLSSPKNQLTNLNLKNGNNLAMIKNSNGNYGMLSFDNPSLKCIQVDNVANANTLTLNSDWAKDIPAKYSENCSLSVADIKKKEISIFPNPVKDILNFSEEVYDITIADVSGKVVRKISAFSKSVDVSKLIKGVYIITCTTKLGRINNLKIIKQ